MGEVALPHSPQDAVTGETEMQGVSGERRKWIMAVVVLLVSLSKVDVTVSPAGLTVKIQTPKWEAVRDH